MPQGLRNLLQRFLRSSRGVALLEFAFIFPIILLLLLGALELARGIIVTQRVEKVTYALADVVSQYPPATADRASGEINETQLRSNVFPQFRRIMGSYGDDNRQMMIFTSVRRENDVVRIKWQIAGGGGFATGVNSAVNGAAPSAIGIAMRNTEARFPGDDEMRAQMASMANGENMIIAEAFYRYDPIWSRAISAVPNYGEQTGFTISRTRTLTKRMYFRPRNGDLICLPDTFIHGECTGNITPPTTPGSSCAGRCDYQCSPCSNEPIGGPLSGRWNPGLAVICEKRITSTSPCAAICVYAWPIYNFYCP